MAGTHGIFGNLYKAHPNGFSGSGLNDATWGTGYSGASSGYFEVEIDAEGSPDTFKWRKDGGSWTTGVAITGAAQTLSDGQAITFGATTGHTLGDKWFIGNLKDEPCTESGAAAQITDSTMRLLNPNATPTFTDSGGQNVIRVDHVRGRATFDGNVTVVTVTGNNAYFREDALEKMSYLYDIKFTPNLSLADKTSFQDRWKRWVPGLAEADGEAGGYFASKKWFEDLKDVADGTQAYFLLQLFTYDPDDDQTGDHFNVWVLFDKNAVAAPLEEAVKEAIHFKAHGAPALVQNA